MDDVKFHEFFFSYNWTNFAGVVLALGFLAAGFSIVESSNFPVGNPEDEQCGVSVEWVYRPPFQSIIISVIHLYTKSI